MVENTSATTAAFATVWMVRPPVSRSRTRCHHPFPHSLLRMCRNTPMANCNGLSRMASTRPECRPGRASSATRRCGKWSTSSVTYPPRAAWGFQRFTKKKRKSTSICTRRKTTTSLPALGHSPRRSLLCKRSDVIHYIPNLLRLHPSFFSCHLPLPTHDDRVHLSIRQVLQRRCIAVVFQL